jgi:threonine/homoserine/homoserine lactone efflux protein
MLQNLYPYFDYLIRGMVVGLTLAVPVGPIGVLCLRRTLNYGWLAGLFSGLGAATADGIFGLIATFSLSWVTDFLQRWHDQLILAASMLLVFLGIKAMRQPPPSVEEGAAEGEAIGVHRLIGYYISTLLLLLYHPIALLAFVSVFASFGAVPANAGNMPHFLLVAGVFIGSAAWWIGIGGAAALLRSRLQLAHFRWINGISGVILSGFGVALLTKWLIDKS